MLHSLLQPTWNFTVKHHQTRRFSRNMVEILQIVFGSRLEELKAYSYNPTKMMLKEFFEHIDYKETEILNSNIIAHDIS